MQQKDKKTLELSIAKSKEDSIHFLKKGTEALQSQNYVLAYASLKLSQCVSSEEKEVEANLAICEKQLEPEKWVEANLLYEYLHLRLWYDQWTKKHSLTHRLIAWSSLSNSMAISVRSLLASFEKWHKRGEKYHELDPLDFGSLSAWMEITSQLASHLLFLHDLYPQLAVLVGLVPDPVPVKDEGPVFRVPINQFAQVIPLLEAFFDEWVEFFEVIFASTQSVKRPALWAARAKLVEGVETLQKLWCEWRDFKVVLEQPEEKMEGAPLITMHGIKGSKKSMEDTHFQIRLYVRGEWVTFLGIFDGHGGSECARFAEAEFPLLMQRRVTYHERDESLDTDQLIRLCLREVCFDGAVEWRTQKMLGPGTTLVLLVYSPKLQRLWTANAGDSDAMVARKKEYERLTNPHRATIAEEKKNDDYKRIHKGGCRIVIGRVDGQLSVTRGIGDLELNIAQWVFNNSYVDRFRDPLLLTTWVISPEPYITSIEVTEDTDFVCLGCDGLFDYVEMPKVGTFVYGLSDSEKEKRVAAVTLCDHAWEEGSKDNITAGIVFFGSKE